MRRLALCTLAVLVTVTMLAPSSAFAQAPAPKVTINGLIDMVSGMTWNMSRFDANYRVRNDNEWYARTRLRPDIIGEIGTTRAVLGFEFDYGWGGVRPGPARTGAASGLAARPGLIGADQNTDTFGLIEMKWGYVEFNTPGLPIQSRMRLGAQPWTATYKNFLAHGDHAGVNWTATVTPNVRFHVTYSQVSEAHTGLANNFFSGDDYAIVSSVEITPFKGLDLRPLYAYFNATGDTGGAARQGRGGVANALPVRGQAALFFNPTTDTVRDFPGPTAAADAEAAGFTRLVAGGVTGVGLTAAQAAGFATTDAEHRHTLGFDARWSSGPFYLDPTFAYQFGDRDVTFAGVSRNAKIRAWFADVRGGFRTGPLLLEVAGIYTSGNKAGQDVRTGSAVRFFQPISTDTGYYGGWANIFALGTDYYQILYGGVPGLNPGTSIGYDKYGLMRFGGKGTYAVTPAFSLLGGVHASWTAEAVDTGSTLSTAAGLTPTGLGPRRSYLGTEVNLGLQWRFAPGVVFDLTGAHLFAGDAIGFQAGSGLAVAPGGIAIQAPGAPPGRPVRDASLIAARIRFTF